MAQNRTTGMQSHATGKSGSQREKTQTSRRGGSGNFAENPQRASDAGRKGGKASHGGTSGQSGR